MTHFKSKDGGSHEMFYRKKGNEFTLFVASENPQPIPNTLSERRQVSQESNDNEEIERITTAQQFFDQKIKPLEEELKKLSNNKPKSTESKATKNAYNSSIDRKTKELRKARKAMVDRFERIKLNHNDRDEIPTVVKPKGKGHVLAEPLTWLEGNTIGQEPGSASPPGWEYAQELRIHSIDKDWVRGHLLSEKLHGPNSNWNLVPIRTGVNTRMETEIESEAKNAIKDKSAILSYETKVTSWWNGDHDDMVHFPKSWTVIMKKMKVENGKLLEDSTPLKKRFEQGRIPMLGETPALNIYDIGGPTIKLLEPSLADVFVDTDIPAIKNDGEGRIKDEIDLEIRVENYLKSKDINRRYDLDININILADSDKIKF